jgi:predicted glutamine amidotransferase
MCRMIAAVGRFDTEPLARALMTMAMNDNPAQGHEHRQLGAEFRHDCGWGAALRTERGFSVVRSTRPCYEDSELERIGCAHTDLAILHARRTPERETIAIENTHPFRADWTGHDYVFCHNGAVNDRRQLTWDPALATGGTIDSEELFYHVLSRFDPDAPADSVAAALKTVDDFTAVNCFLAWGRSLVAYQRMADGNEHPLYYTLWHGVGDEFEVVSSEVVDGLSVTWSEIPPGTAIRLALQ